LKNLWHITGVGQPFLMRSPSYKQVAMPSKLVTNLFINEQGRIAKTDNFDKQIGVNMKDIPAFPVNPDINIALDMKWAGMTLRDYFAARAMASAIPYWKLDDEELSISFDEIAKDSYDIADAMLKYREKA
jgi:hypothetical protein